jgi:FkbM family methyltransferase
VARFEPYDTARSYGGWPLKVRIADPMSMGWYDRDWPPLAEIEFLKKTRALTEGATVFDLGAHQAVIALILAREIGPEGRVIAVEAERHNIRVAAQNVRANDAGNVRLVHSAVAAEPGTLQFAEGLNGRVDNSTRWGTVTVPAVTIDQLASEHGTPDMILLDVEGYEGRALQGATTTLGNGLTAFCVEVHVDRLVGCTTNDVLEQFSDFEVYVASEAAAHEPGAHAFHPIADGLPEGRFFLVAQPR